MKPFLLLTAIVAAPSAASAAPAEPAKPRWIVDWAANQCSLMRESGGDKIAGISVRMVPGTDTVNLAMVDERWKAEPLPEEAAVVIRLDAGDPVESKVSRLGGQGRFGLIAFGVGAAFIDSLSKAKAIRVDANGAPLLSLGLPGSAKAVAALRECEADALRRWGIDPAGRATLQRPATPKAEPHRIMSNADYPMEAIRRREQGTSVARMIVEPDGSVGDCGIVSSSGSELLDARTCAIFTKRLRFDPAIAADGQPVRAVAVSRITWRMGG